MMARLYPERVVYYSTTTLMTISSFHGVDSPLFARITERGVDIKSPLYRGSNAPLEQPEEEEEEEEEVLFCARQKQLCRHRSKSKLEIILNPKP